MAEPLPDAASILHHAEASDTLAGTSEEDMAQALYRRWRPQTWDEVVGQDHIVLTLQNAVKGERVAHAYLFSGPRGTGKTTTARLLAKAVNCLHDSLDERPCNACEYCLALNEGRFLDLVEIDAASNTSVEDVRDLRDKINFAPNQGRFKVYIVDEVHMLSTAAFNALLKTLEEPPAHAIFVLATTEVHKIPATVLSRCQRHEFRRLPVATIVEYLEPKASEEGLKIDGQALELIARQATGSLRDAISLLDQLTSTGDEVTLALARGVLGTAAGEAVRGVVDALAGGDRAAGLTLINRALDGGADPRQFSRQVVDYLRSLLLVQLGAAELVETTEDERADMLRQANGLPLPRLLAAIAAFSRAGAVGRSSWLPGLPLEMALIEAIDAGKAREQPSSASTHAASPEAASASKQSRKRSAKKVKEAPAAAEEYAEKEEDSEKPPQSKSQVAEGGLTFQVLKERWTDVLASARRLDRAAQALINSGRPLGLEGEVLVLGFASDLLREKMEKEQNVHVARTAIEETLNVPLGIRCVLTEKWRQGERTATPPPVEDGGMVATAMRDLGAQVSEVKQDSAQPDDEED
jgi:DNA polymerase-3 subunit gamma/tau